MHQLILLLYSKHCTLKLLVSMNPKVWIIKLYLHNVYNYSFPSHGEAVSSHLATLIISIISFNCFFFFNHRIYFPIRTVLTCPPVCGGDWSLMLSKVSVHQNHTRVTELWKSIYHTVGRLSWNQFYMLVFRDCTTQLH